VGADGHCLNWSYRSGLSGIIASWVISPVMAGVFTITCYVFTDFIMVHPPMFYKRVVGRCRLTL